MGQSPRQRPAIAGRRWLPPLAAVVGALVVWNLLQFAHPAIQLRPSSVVVQGQPADVERAFRDSLTGSPNVLVREPDRLVASFRGTAAPFSFRTVELVTFGDGYVSFEQVGGTFYAGGERFTLTSDSPGETHIEHSGSFTMRGGLVGWLLGEIVVRRLFEGRVAAEMARL